MPELSQRVQTFTDSVIRRMTRIANRYGAINLSQGFPDFDPPMEVMDALEKVATKDLINIPLPLGQRTYVKRLLLNKANIPECPLILKPKS